MARAIYEISYYFKTLPESYRKRFAVKAAVDNVAVLAVRQCYTIVVDQN